MSENRMLSKKSKEFLENLRSYLFSSGKDFEDIEAIVEELETHLYEAEQDGKSIEKIIGKSPKDYMKTISREMTADYRKWTVYVLLIAFGSMTIYIFPDLIKGNISLSVLEVIGHILITVIFIVSVLVGFRYISTNMISFKRSIFILYPITILPVVLFIGLIYLNKIIATPVLQFGITGSIMVGIAMTIFIVGMSIWSKTWIIIIVMTLLIIPDYILGLTSLRYGVQQILSFLITFGGIAIYLLIYNKLEKGSNIP